MVQEGSVSTTKQALGGVLGWLPRCRLALEVGRHSPWVSRLLKSMGHEGIVAHARQVKRIRPSSRQEDRLEAQTVARLARGDPPWLRPIQHRSEKKGPGHRGVERLEGLAAAVGPAREPRRPEVASWTAQIHECDRNIEPIARREYPESEVLPQGRPSVRYRDGSTRFRGRTPPGTGASRST